MAQKTTHSRDAYCGQELSMNSLPKTVRDRGAENAKKKARKDKTFLIAEPMRKVSWTRRCAAGRSVWRCESGASVAGRPFGRILRRR